MNKKEFLRILDKRLKALPQEERESALTFYKEHIEESPNEVKAIEKLPHPKQIAAKLIIEFGSNLKSSGSGKQISIATVIFAILSSPITIPLAIVLVLLIFLLVLMVLLLQMSVAFIALGFFSVGVSTLLSVVTTAAFAHSIGTGFIMLGISLITISISFLLANLTLFLLKRSFAGIRALAAKIAIRRFNNDKA